MEEGEYIGEDLDDLSFSDPPSVVPFQAVCSSNHTQRVAFAPPMASVDVSASPIRPAHLLTANQDASTPVVSSRARDVLTSPINLDASLSNSWMLYKFLQNGTLYSALVSIQSTQLYSTNVALSYHLRKLFLFLFRYIRLERWFGFALRGKSFAQPLVEPVTERTPCVDRRAPAAAATPRGVRDRRSQQSHPLVQRTRARPSQQWRSARGNHRAAALSPSPTRTRGGASGGARRQRYFFV